MASATVFEGYNLYVLPDKFYFEPRGKDGNLLSSSYLVMDRHTNQMYMQDSNTKRIPIAEAEIQYIHGIVGTIPLVSGLALVVIKRSRIVGSINGHSISALEEAQIIPFKKTTLHLTEKQIWFERLFTDMVHSVLATGGFYFSYTYDISHSLQWLGENGNPDFHHRNLLERADLRFVWNGYLLQQLRTVQGAAPFLIPIIHGFFGQTTQNVNTKIFKLTIISRRSTLRAGVRFYKRGVCPEGNPANYVETEQIVEFEQGNDRKLTSFVQLRGSIPLFWSQKPNLKWQPCPTMKPTDDQFVGYERHFRKQKELYGGRHVIVNLINQKGREKRIGSELERVIQQANLQYVRYNPFDFHKECHAMKWDRLSILRDQLSEEINGFGFFASSLTDPQFSHIQTGFFRTNCMDCLDRTNVVQAMIARESLSEQLMRLDIIPFGERVENILTLESAFKCLWADNGDECSKQYAGTGALKADFTRLGRRTYAGAMNDGINAVTRYFRNNFADGYRQDSIDLFLGNFVVDSSNLPDTLQTTLLSFEWNGIALLAALFAFAMTVLCVLVAENLSATVFWLVVFFFCMSFIFFNGEEFVNTPKLKKD